MTAAPTETSASGSSEGWRDYHKRVRPLPDDIGARVAEKIAGHDRRVLLLGVTQAYAELGADLTAVDWCEEQIARVWIGDRPDRRAVFADWREMDVGHESFTAAVGDGSLSTLVWPDDYRRTLERVAWSLVPKGRLVVRCFVAPDVPETAEQVAADTFAGRVPSFFSARWRIAMALAGSGNVRVAAIHDAFERVFPDRNALADATGWDRETIDVIDAYRNSNLVYSFLDRRDLVEIVAERFDDPRLVPSGNYPMAERYPLLVAERRR
ncbi:MAG: class I SAM-dependent methyltransferase [Croceibacterium sp.]